MSWTVAAEASTTTDGTEQTLSTQTTNGTYVFVIDTGAMVNDDVIEIRLKTKARSSSTSRISLFARFKHIQAQPDKFSEPLPITNELVVTLKRVGGTDRTYDWQLLRT